MTIELKYQLGEEVYIVSKVREGIVILRSIIDEIAISQSKGVLYYLGVGEEYEEEELIPIDRKDLLVKRIDGLLEEENVKN